MRRIMFRCAIVAVSLVMLVAGIQPASGASLAARAATTVVVTRALGGAPPDANSQLSGISSDGNVIAFSSHATNLVGGDTNGQQDVFVFDRSSEETELVSLTASGGQTNDYSLQPSLSADGRYVTYMSVASNIVSGDSEVGNADVFLYDRQLRKTEAVSVSMGGSVGTGLSSAAEISDDGRLVVFASDSASLVPGDTNGVRDIFVRDLVANTTTRVSVGPGGTPSNGSSDWPAISADGATVSFFSNGRNLVEGDTNEAADVFVHDLASQVTERVSVASDGSEALLQSSDSSLSGDGRYVAFQSFAPNLVPGDTNAIKWDIFVHDRETGRTERVSVSSAGEQANERSFGPSISDDGRTVAFQSFATNLDELPPQNAGATVIGELLGSEEYVHDRVSRITERVSVNPQGGLADRSSFSGSISADGRTVVFTSAASNLGGAAAPSTTRIFLRDRGTEIGFSDLDAEGGGGVEVSGRARFPSEVVGAKADVVGDAAPASAGGSDLLGASLVLRPERQDVLAVLDLVALPPQVAGAPGVVYGVDFTIGGSALSARATRLGTEGKESFRLLTCSGTTCQEVATLRGSIGTSGERVFFSIPRSAVPPLDGAIVSGVRGFVAAGPIQSTTLAPIDEVVLGAVTLPARTVHLGIAPADAGEDEVTFQAVPQVAAGGQFNGSFGPAPAGHRVWARACLGESCAAETVLITVGTPGPGPTSTPTPTPTASPTPSPSESQMPPTPTPTPTPSESPTTDPTQSPTSEPTEEPGPTTPAAPSNTTARAASSSRIEIAWADNSSNETGFTIERSLDGSKWTEIATANRNATMHLDMGLDPDTTYFYRVRALNSAGYSDYSNTASATTSRATRIAFTQGSDGAGQYSDVAALEARLSDDQDQSLEDREVTFALLRQDGSSAWSDSAVTDAEGQASVGITLTESPGTYTLTVRYAGESDRYDDSAASTSFEVHTEDTATTVAAEGKGAKQTLTAMLADLDSSAGIEGRSIDFYGDGNHLGSATTDAGGNATIHVPPRYRGGNHDFEARFAGDDYYLGSSSNDPEAAPRGSETRGSGQGLPLHRLSLAVGLLRL